RRHGSQLECHARPSFDTGPRTAEIVAALPSSRPVGPTDLPRADYTSTDGRPASPIARRALDMKITEVVCQILRIPNVQAKTASSQDSVLVRVRTDAGLEGVGEADSSPEVVKAIIDAPFSHNIACGLRQLLIGEHPLEHE